MSSTSLNTNKIPQSIGQRLKKLRGQISQFLLVDGLSRLLAVVLGLALLDVLLDRVFKMDLAQRGILLAVMVIVILAVAFFRLVKPFSKRATDDALILQVEEKNRELKESVISAAQFSRGGGYEDQGYSQTMVDATIRRGSEMAEKINFGNTIDGGAFARNGLLLLASLAGIAAIGYGVANTDFWQTWFNRNILLTNDQWPRATMLAIDGVENGSMTLPRGEDHKQMVRVLPESRVSDVDVSIEFDDDGSRTTQKMRCTSDLEHMLVFRNLSSEFRFRAMGGDDVTDWVQIKLVEAPGWSDLKMTVTMPEYTGLGELTLPPGGGPHTIMEGAGLSIQATGNKPLTSASLKAGDQQWPMLEGEGNSWSLSVPPADLIGGKYTFDVADDSGLRSSKPTSFSVKVKPDRAPTVRGTLRGISGQVVSRARIPISFTAGDEFAIDGMRIEYSWQGNSATSVAQGDSIDLAAMYPKLKPMIGQSEIKSRVVLDLEPLDIPTGVSLRFSVNATDNNTLSGPNEGKSREFLLRVVPEDELRADLLRREIEQRKAFELVINSQERLIDDLNRISDLAQGSNAGTGSDEMLDELRDAQRRQKLVGTNSSRVADRFEEFLVEAINNRLDEAEDEIGNAQSIAVRFNERIIDPIRQLDKVGIIAAAQLIEKSQRAIGYDSGTGQKSVDKPALIDGAKETITRQKQILDEMNSILSAMQDSETYQEIVNKVIEIKRNEEAVREMAREKADEAGNRGIFDDNGEDMFDEEDSDDEKSKDG